MNCGHGLDIGRVYWQNGLFCFDSTPAGCRHPGHLIPHRTGNVNLHLKFGAQTNSVLNLVVHANFRISLKLIAIVAWSTIFHKALNSIVMNIHDSRTMASYSL